MEKKVAFVSFGGGAGKFYSEDFHVRLDGSNLREKITRLPNNEIWMKYDRPKYEKLCALNGWDATDERVLNMFVYVDQTGWNGCDSSRQSFSKVVGEYHWMSELVKLYIPAKIVENVIENTDDKVLNCVIPMCNSKFETKNFEFELHMVDAYEQLPSKL